MDDEHFQRISGEIHPFPKTVCPEKYARIGVLPKLMNEFVLSSAHPLGKQLDTGSFQLRSKRERGFFDTRERSEKYKRASLDYFQKLHKKGFVQSFLVVFPHISKFCRNI